MTMTVHHVHTPGNPVLLDGIPTPPHCSVCGVRIVHNLRDGEWVPARTNPARRMTEIAVPMDTFDGGKNCRNCHRPVVVHTTQRFELAVWVHTATMARGCGR